MKAMKPEKKVVICTGPPGNGRDEILLKMRERSSFNYYHMFEYIVEEARLAGINLTKLNILDFYDSQPEKMDAFHDAAVRRISAEIESRGGVNIVSTPYRFEWKGNSYIGLREDEAKVLDPDLYVLIFDDLIRARDRLSKDVQWRDHRFTLGEIANWRREEVAGVYRLAKASTRRKEVQLVAFENGPDFLREIVYGRGKEKIYLSHPITGEGEGFFGRVTRFADSLSEYYVVFDPYMIKDWNLVDAWRSAVNEATEKGLERPKKLWFSIEYKDGPVEEELDSIEVESAIKNMRFQIIDTDYKLIENSSIVVVYHPRESISAGVMCEMVYAKSLAKLVYAYYPYEPSPFFEWYATRIFRDEGELRDFLIKESRLTGQTPLDIFSYKVPEKN